LRISPAAEAEPVTRWTRARLLRRLRERLGCLVSPRTMARTIHSLGYRWRRPKLTVKAEDALAAQRIAVMEAARAAHPEAVELFSDECDVLTLPVVRGQYQPVGEQREIPTPGTRKKHGLFGFLNVRTGAWHYWLRARKRSKEFLECLHELLWLYPTGTVLLFVDNASIHKSKVTLRFLANHPRLVVCYLPTYSGHKQNPVEKVWWALKEEIAANYLWPSLEALEDAIHGFFAELSPEKALRLTRRADPKADPQPTLAPDLAWAA
jgi:DDE superfamily endonuclease/Winged helix-turn helix